MLRRVEEDVNICFIGFELKCRKYKFDQTLNGILMFNFPMSQVFILVGVDEVKLIEENPTCSYFDVDDDAKWLITVRR